MFLLLVFDFGANNWLINVSNNAVDKYVNYVENMVPLTLEFLGPFKMFNFYLLICC